MTDKEAERLFAAGVQLLLGRAYPAAYSCFDRLPAQDFRLLYNKALCCFMVEWYDECHRLLCEAERFLPGVDIAREAPLPEAFSRYDYDKGEPFSPMPQGMPVSLAYRQLLRLKAETAFKLHLYSEVKTISNRLGRKYRHIEILTDTQDNNDDW